LSRQTPCGRKTADRPIGRGLHRLYTSLPIYHDDFGRRLPVKKNVNGLVSLLVVKPEKL